MARDGESWIQTSSLQNLDADSIWRKSGFLTDLLKSMYGVCTSLLDSRWHGYYRVPFLIEATLISC